mmetsp:Transcript_28366/g.52985  ORF Transcript_28366/g.52985 Transcript_28366/m.52985 type:complete len:89 (-) Transcript_28366:415-681(-)
MRVYGMSGSCLASCLRICLAARRLHILKIRVIATMMHHAMGIISNTTRKKVNFWGGLSDPGEVSPSSFRKAFNTPLISFTESAVVLVT